MSANIRLCLLAALPFLVGCASMESPDVILPPAQYDHPFAGRLVVEQIPLRDVQAACRLHPASGYTEACAWTFADPMQPGKLACRIIYPRLSDVGADMMVALNRHETGHCDGWPANHPGGHF